MIKINDYIVTPTIFPDKTSQIWKLPEKILELKNVEIRWDYECENEIIWLDQLKTLLGREGVQSTLYISYLPYARQDRTPSNINCFALYNFARMLNNMYFPQVTILDPHNIYLTKSLIFNSIIVNPFDVIKETICITEADFICFPDEGALNRYSKGNFNIPLFSAIKDRDSNTGEINSIKLNLRDSILNKKILLVDDICDGGRTFIELSKQLRIYGECEVFLYITHGLFTKGLKPLFDSGITRIFTYNGEVFND